MQNKILRKGELDNNEFVQRWVAMGTQYFVSVNRTETPRALSTVAPRIYEKLEDVGVIVASAKK